MLKVGVKIRPADLLGWKYQALSVVTGVIAVVLLGPPEQVPREALADPREVAGEPGEECVDARVARLELLDVLVAGILLALMSRRGIFRGTSFRGVFPGDFCLLAGWLASGIRLQTVSKSPCSTFCKLRVVMDYELHVVPPTASRPRTRL